MGKHKRHYHRLTGFALFIVAIFATIFSHILMPVGGSKAAPSYAIFMDGASFNRAISNIIDPAAMISIRRDDCSNIGRNPVRVEDSTLSPERIYARTEDRENVYYCSDANTLYLSKDSSTMFQNFKNVTRIDTIGWDTSNVEDMNNMFASCSSLTNLDVSSWNTSSVKDMSSMFRGCGSITGLDTSHFDTSSVKNMSSMFKGCSSLTGLDTSRFDTSSVSDMGSMFEGCSILAGLDVTSFVTSNVTNMGSMFAGCSSLTGLDVSRFDTSNVTDMSNMFQGCSSLVGLDVTNFNTRGVTNMGSMFAGCSSLTGLDVSRFDTSNVTNMSNMFQGCSSLTEIPVDNFVTSGVTNMSNMFNGCSSLKGVDVSHWNTSKVTNMSYMFNGCSSIEILDLNSFNTNRVTNMSYMFKGCTGLTELYVDRFVTTGVTNMSYMFSDCRSLKGVDVSNWNTSKVTNMRNMFAGCSKIEELNLRNFDTIRVTNMSYMFYGCSDLGKLYIDRFVTTGVTNMSYMFQGCSSLGEIDLSSFDTRNVTNMSYMFAGCSSLTDLDLSSFELKKSSINMSYMFQGCSNLTSIKIAYLVTTGVTNTSYMFKNCSSLSNLDLRNRNTSNVTNMNQMFYGCSNLDTIYVSATGFNTTRVTNSNSSNMFYNTSKLIGGHGTTWSSSVVNKTRAVPDSESVSGYLTYDIAVSFQTVSGVELARQIISVSSRPTIPTITGYRILGYYKNTGMTSNFNFNQNLAKYTQVYLEWECDTGYILKNGQCVEPITTTFLPGETVNERIKNLANGVTIQYYENDTLIQQIVRTGSLAQGFTTGLLSTPTSEIPIIAWFDSGILYYYTEADIMYLNPNSNHMFCGIQSVTNIDTSGWDTSNVIQMNSMFHNCSSLINLDINNRDTSNVTNMSTMFRDCSNLISLDLNNWDTSNVTSMGTMFQGCSSLTELDISSRDTSSVTSMQGMFESCRRLTGMNLSNWDTSNVTNMAYLFNQCSGLTQLNLSGWDTSNVTNMTQMFTNCRNLTELDLSNRDTSSVTNMTQMFAKCSSLTELNLSGRDTSSVTSMGAMFRNCSSLIELDISSRNTSNVTNMGTMFQGCNSLTELDISSRDTSSGINMSSMFQSCSNLTELNLTNWNTSSVTNMKQMFYGDNNLETIYTSTGFITSGVTDSTNMFSNTPKLIGGYGTKRSSSYTDKTRAVIDSTTASGYFTYDIAVSYRTRTGVELARQIISVGSSTVAPTITGYHVLGYYANTGFTSIFNFSQNLRKYTEVYVDWECDTGYKLENGVCEKIYTTTFRIGTLFNSVVKTLAKGYTLNIDDELYSGDDELFSGDEESYSGGNWLALAGDVDTGIIQILRTGSIPAGVTTGLLSTSTSEVPVIAYFDSGIIYYYTQADIIYLNSNSRFMFFREHNLTYVDTSGRDTSNVRTMNYMFGGCNSLTRVDTSSWDTSNVTNMRRMFSTCSSLTGVDVSGWDTSSVTNMDHMFNGCENLKTLDVSSWDTSSVQIAQNMFWGCKTLTGLDVHNWDTSSMTDLHSMFSDCRNLETLDVSNWDTSSAIQMNAMFNDCYKLKGLDLHNWNTSNVTDMSTMFDNCRNLTGLNISGWNTANVTDMKYMFSNCTGLTELDVHNWNTANVTNMSGMFYNCKNLTTIYASTGFITSGVTESSNMFYNTSKLMGGHGTKWSSSYKDKTRAKLDSETVSGYLTYDIAVSYRDNTTELTRQVISVGSSTVAPIIHRTGYVVSGWYTNTGYTTLFNFSQILRKYTQVYAKWACDTGYTMDASGVCVRANISVLFIANPSTFSLGHFSDGTTQKTIEYKYMSGGYFAAVDKEIQVPELSGVGNTGYMFEGWYINTGYSEASRWTGLSENTLRNITLYARYLPFRDKTVTRGGVTFTVMDRNLGALDYSSGYSYNNDQSNQSRIGLYYQRGNNFGFPNNGTLSNTLSGILIERYSSTPRGPGNYYFNGVFVKWRDYPRYSGAMDRDNLWGGGGIYATNPDTDRQGPCPQGYHIPYNIERNAVRDLFNRWYISSEGAQYCASIHTTRTGIQYCLPAALGLPFGGYRHDASATAGNQKTHALYWSARSISGTLGLNFISTSGNIQSNNGASRSYGFSLRCFKDSPYLTLSFNSSGGSSVAAQTGFRWWQARSTAPTTPTRANSTFSGWYLDTGFTEKFTFSDTTYIGSDTTLYAKWVCNSGCTLNSKSECISNNISILFIANPSTFSLGHFSDNTTQKTIQYRYMTGGYYAAVDKEIQIPELSGAGNTGYMFEGWYTNTGYSAASRWTGLSENTLYTGITLYARYLPFRDKTVTRGGITFTIMDRNLGALDYSSGYSYHNDQSNESRIGLYYQRGNNFGFPNTGTLPNTLSGVLIERYSSTPRGPGNYYFNGSFVKTNSGYRHSGAVAFENLWGGGGTNASNAANKPDIDRQGPCPQGYHVPDKRELVATRNLFNKWVLTADGSAYCTSIHTTNTGIQYCLPAALGLPFAGYRNYPTSVATNHGNLGLYRASTASTATDASYMNFHSSVLNPQNANSRAYGLSIRCYKNSSYLTLSFNSNGGSSVSAQTGFRWWQARSTAPTTPTRANSTFSGWYLNTGLTDKFTFSGTTYIGSDTTLYARWICNSGYIQSVDGQSCITYTVNFYPNGATSIGADTLTGISVTMPNITRSGWTIIGWSTDSGATVAEYSTGETISLNGDLDLYAITKKTYTATFEANGADSIGSTTATCDVYNRETSCGAGQNDITICNPNKQGECLTISDRNMGALVASTGSCSYGNYFQWGNNYGFPSTGTTIPSTTTKATWNNNYNNHGYYGQLFITVENAEPYDYWSDGIHNNIWGGSGDRADNGYGYTGGTVTNVEGRRGPCPKGYHVPSRGEWGTALGRWAAEYTGAGNTLTLNGTAPAFYFSDNTASSAFKDYFLISPAGSRSFTSTYLSNQGSYAFLWTSSPNSSNNDAGRLYLWSGDVNANFSYKRATGFPVRCFKDVPRTQARKAQPSIISPSITCSGREVLGWSTNSGDTTAQYSGCDTIRLYGDTTFYAITKKTYTATFEANGADSIGTTSATCDVYNTETTCGGAGTITICDPEQQDTPKCLTISDRNLGATIAGTGLCSYGNYYQWGNNYGFPNTGDTIPSTTTKVDTSNFGPGNYYSGSTYIIATGVPRDRSIEHNGNLWGGITNTYEAMQGPCPEGYHIPTSGEWSNLLNWWNDSLYDGNSSTMGNQFRDTFFLPFAGGRNHTSTTIYHQGEHASYWSSNAYNSANLDQAYRMYFTPDHRDIETVNRRVYGYQLRCFKNSSWGYSGLTYQPRSIQIPSITRSGRKELGWSTNSGDTTAQYGFSDCSEIVLSGDTTFYAITTKILTATFRPNGNKLNGGTSTITKDCTIYNTDNSCSVVTPTISASGNNTPIIVGYTTGSDGTGTANIGSNTGILIYGGEIYFAQTKSNQYTYNATYRKDTVSTTATTSGTLSCTTTITYNGVTPNQNCNVSLGTITCRTASGYTTPKWNGSYNPSSTAPISGNTTFTGACTDTTRPVCAWGKPMPYCISGGMAGSITLTCTDGVGISQTSVSSSNISYDTHLLTLSNGSAANGTSTSKSYTFYYTGISGVSGSTGFILKTGAVTDTSNNGNLMTGPSKTVGVDNLGPDIPTMIDEPEYTPGLENRVRSTEVRDNGCNGKVQYQFCMKTEATIRTGGDINERLQDLGGGLAEGIERTGTAPGAKAPKIIELGEKKGEIQAWYERGIIYIFTTASVIKLPENSSHMFENMSKLKSINLGNIDTSAVMNMSYMFAGCSGLKILDLSQFDMSNTTNVNSMFAGDTSLATIYVSENFVLGEGNKVDGIYMFDGCSSLVGGLGTVYDKDHTDHEYAHIDGGKSNPGYFTQIQKKTGVKAPVDDGFGCEATSDWLLDPVAEFTNLTDGYLYGYYVRSSDGLGNTSTWSHATSSTQDDKDPVISFNKSSGTAAQSHSVLVTVRDVTAGLAANQQIKYRWQTGSTCSQTASQYNIGLLSPTTTGANTATVTVTTAGLSDGSYYLCVLSGSVRDQVGHINQTTKTSGVFVVDNTKPICTRGIPTQICISGGMAGSITLTCTDGVGISQTSVLSSKIQYNTGLLTLGNSNTVSGTSGSKTYTFIYTGIANVNGTTGFTLKANAVKDTANNGNLATGPSQSIQVDNMGPSAPILNTTASTNDTTPTLSWSEVTNNNGCSTMVGYDIWVCTDSNCNTATRSGTRNSTTWDVSSALPATAGTTYYWKVRAKDALGNLGSWSNISSFLLDTIAPTYTLISWTGYECSTGTAIISGATDTGAGLASSPYSWAGTYGTNTGYSLYRGSTGIQTVAVLVKDAVGNVTTSRTASLTWQDKELQITTPYSLSGMLTGAKVITNLIGSTVFNVTGYGSCETVSVTTGTCTNATMILNGVQLTITPISNFQGSGSCILYFTDGDTTKTGEIKFNIQTLLPTISFTGTYGNQINPSSCTNKIDRNRFLTKMNIGNTPELGNFMYSISNGSITTTNTLYDDSLILMYNFDNISALGDSNTVVKDLSMHGNDGIISSNVIATGGKWGGSYFFNAGHISVNDNSITVTNNFTASARIKTDTVHDNRNGHFLSRWYPDDNKRVWSMAVDSGGYLIFLVSKTGGAVNDRLIGPNILDGQWHHAVMVHNGNDVLMYTDGIYIGKISNIGSLNDIPRILTIGNYLGGISFYGYIDEVRMYNRALSQDEVQFLYRSNLSKVNTGQWLFQVLNTCLDTNKTYIYSGQVTSLYGYGTGKSQTTCTQIPGVTITGGMDINLGTGIVSNTGQILSGQYTSYIQVEDWRAKSGWIGSVRVSSNFSGQNTNLGISSTNLNIKNHAITDLGHYLTGYIPEYTTGLVQLNPVLNSFANISIYNGNNQGTPYFMSNYPEGDFMCNGGVYGDYPYFKLNVPPWTPGDKYIATIYWTIEPTE